MKTNKKKTKRRKEDDLDLGSFLDAMPDDAPFLDDEDSDMLGFLSGEEETTITVTQEVEVKKKKAIGRGGYVKDVRPDMSNGIQQGHMLQEIVAMRGIIPERYEDEDWARVLHSVGHLPFYILCEDIDRYHLCIYAAEQLRGPDKAEVKRGGLKYLPRTGSGHDHTAHQEALDGRRWGGVDPEFENHTKTVREQVTEKQKKLIEDKRKETVASIIKNDRYDDPIKLRWQQAEKLARIGKRDEWDGMVSPEFQSMVEFCFRWIKEVGRVPRWPHDPIDVYWERPGLVKGYDEETNKRRDSVVRKIIKLWRRMVAEAREQGKALDLRSTSYRTVLAAMALQKAVEEYAWNHKVWKVSEDRSKPVAMELLTPDEELLEKVKKLTKKYFRAHFPLKNPPPGPKSSIDPDFHTYIRLCRKYGLKQGALLHKQTTGN